MKDKKISDITFTLITKAQKSTITNYAVYLQLAKYSSNKKDEKHFTDLSSEEKKQYLFWKKYTKIVMEPNYFLVNIFMLLGKIFGFSFTLKLLANNTEKTQVLYQKIIHEIPETKDVLKDKEKYKDLLKEVIKNDQLEYVGSIVLGLSNSLVELTGALTGLALALQNARLVAVAGLITGTAASLFITLSEYSTGRYENKNAGRNPVTSSLYLGGIYIFSVFVLLFPYFIFPRLYIALGFSLLFTVAIMLLFTLYISITQNIPFKKQAFQIFTTSFGIAIITFTIGYIVRKVLHIEI